MVMWTSQARLVAEFSFADANAATCFNDLYNAPENSALQLTSETGLLCLPNVHLLLRDAVLPKRSLIGVNMNADTLDRPQPSSWLYLLPAFDIGVRHTCRI